VTLLIQSRYADALERDARRQLWAALIPDVLMRLRRRRMYRRSFPGAFVADEADVSRHATIGDGAIVRAKVVIGPSVTVGDCTTFGVSCLLRGAGAIAIGPFCSIGPEVAILSENHVIEGEAIYPLELYRDGANVHYNEFRSAPVTIGGDCWIGQRAMILAGAQIGPGSVVAAGSVVTAGTYPPFAIIGGMPARVIKRRFDAAAIERLLADPWWERPRAKIFGADFDGLHRRPGSADVAD
jgi:acetyltransferase-like isoleucine patch superfamily enzyme